MEKSTYTFITLSAQDWRAYLQRQIDSWPAWKKASSSADSLPAYSNNQPRVSLVKA